MGPLTIADLIMSANNPDGHTIEALIDQLVTEIERKDAEQPSPRNCATIGYLHLAKSAQRKRMDEAGQLSSAG